jgi:hypothetical protein
MKWDVISIGKGISGMREEKIRILGLGRIGGGDTRIGKGTRD